MPSHLLNHFRRQAMMARAALLLLACLCAARALAAADTFEAEGDGRRQLGAQRSRRELKAFIPSGGKGSWSSGHPTPFVAIHATVMRDGDLVMWTPWNKKYSSAIYNPNSKSSKKLLGNAGIHGEYNAFCAGQSTSVNNEVFIFGGHADDLEWFRRYNHNTGVRTTSTMPSNRWYPTPCTLPEGKVLVVGGVTQSGAAGYAWEDKPVDNPTITVFDPSNGQFSPDRNDMRQQLQEAFPIHTYPVVTVTPDGGVAVAAGKTLVKYSRNGDRFSKQFSYPDRPGAPWSYPMTGVGLPLPLKPPYNRMFFLAAGGSAQDRAKENTPASAAAHVIELTAGSGARWQASSMPYPRVMGDAVTLCDGTIGVFNGGAKGVGGWSKVPTTYKFKDGTQYKCTKKCSKAGDFVLEPTIYDPESGQWSAKGSLAQAARPRGYHSFATLLPDCSVMISGSDVTDDKTAEFFRPPYLSKGARPSITSAPGSTFTGQQITVDYSHSNAARDPVERAILIRTGSVTHSQAFDARAVWVPIVSHSAGRLVLQMPNNRNVVPQGMYFLNILTRNGVPAQQMRVIQYF